MEETNNLAPVETTAEPPQPLNALQRFLGVFTSPLTTFQSIAAKPDWIVPLIILVLCGVVVARLTAPAALSDTAQRYEKMVESGKLTQEQADKIIEAGQGYSGLIAVFLGGFGVIISGLVAAAILLFIGNVIMSGKASYRQIFSIYLWTGMVGLIGDWLRIPLALKQNTMLVSFGPAAFFGPEAQESALFRACASLDVFVLWRVILISLGFAVLYRFTVGKSLAVILSLYVLLIVASVAFSGLF